jgi:hypothetical protein
MNRHEHDSSWILYSLLSISLLALGILVGCGGDDDDDSVTNSLQTGDQSQEMSGLSSQSSAPVETTSVAESGPMSVEESLAQTEDSFAQSEESLGSEESTGTTESVSGPCWEGVCPTGWRPSLDKTACIYKGDTVTFKGSLVEFGSDDKKIGGATVYLYENDNEGIRYPACTKSDKSGNISLNVPKEWKKIGLMAVMSGYKETYQFQLSSTATDETVWIVTESLYKLAPRIAGIAKLDPAKAVAAGAVYFVDAQGKEVPVGCAKVSSDQGGEIRYFDDKSMPTTTNNQASTNKANGYFLVANIAAGNNVDGPQKVSITASVDGVNVGDTSIWTYAGSICIGNIYTYPNIKTDPTPNTCK